MASNGSLTTKEYVGKSLTLSWSIKSQSIENNTTTISWSLVGSGSQGAQYYVTCRKFKVVIDGVAVYHPNPDYSIDLHKGEVVASGTHTISHNTDGSKSFTAYVEAAIYYSTVNSTAEASWQLTTIPRASSITSANNITLGNNCNIKWTPASSNFKYKIKFSLGNWSYTTGFITPNTTNDYTYTEYVISGTTTANNTTIYTQLPNSISGTMTAVLYTYNSDESQIGSTSSKTFTVTIPNSVMPTVGTITIDPVNITTSDGVSRNILVKGKNKVTVSVSGCSAGAGSNIKSYTFSGPNVSVTTTGTSVTSSSVISNTGTLTYTIQVTDTRGRTASKTATITCYDYAAPYFKSFSAYKANANGDADENGSYIKCNYTIGYSSVNSTNNVTVKILYKKNKDTSDYSSINSILNSTSTSGSSLLDSIDSSSTYTVYALITDNYNGSVPSTSITIFGESRILNITKDGTGFAIGKLAESSNLFECRWDAKFNNNISCVDIDCDNVTTEQISCGQITIDGKTILDFIYPVGSIYISVNSVSPSNLLGGTWERIQDRFLLASGDTYKAGETGGEATHKLTIDEMPSHTHTQQSCTDPGDHTHDISIWYDGSSGSAKTVEGWSVKAHEQYHTTSGAGGHTHTITLNNTGGNVAHNNMPPYLAVYMWKRTA